jgi:siroheme synthase-like protein
VRYYPVFLDLTGKTVLVVGGGNIAHQKMENLLKAGAEVTVISPELNEPMAVLKAEGRFRHIEREYKPGDIEGYSIAFVATDDRSANEAINREGKERRVWVNAVDDPPYCDFIMPGIVQRGDLVIAISTSGRSPAMARKMREELTDFLTEEWVAMLELAAEVRAELRTRDVFVDSDTWNAALDDELKNLLKEGRNDEAKQRLLRSLQQAVGGS